MWCGGCTSDLEPDRFYAGQRWCKGCLSRASGEALGRRRARNKRFLLDHLAVHPCEACGERDPVVLEFDHQGPKRSAVSVLAWNECGLDTLDHEMDGCDVRCASCHRRRTAMEGRHYRYVALTQPL
jgi:hypothetical protein